MKTIKTIGGVTPVFHVVSYCPSCGAPIWMGEGKHPEAIVKITGLSRTRPKDIEYSCSCRSLWVLWMQRRAQ